MKLRRSLRSALALAVLLAPLLAGCVSSDVHETTPSGSHIVCPTMSRGCGIPGQGSAQPSQETSNTDALCGLIPSLRRLVVSRTDAFPQNHFRFSFPKTVTVSNRSRVRVVARALCALPVMPTGIHNCPADFGIIYHLAFSAPGRIVSSVSAEIGNCEVVRGVGASTRWVARSPGFWTTLGMAMGLTSPSPKTFAGSRAA
jgi:hypothetical protein